MPELLPESQGRESVICALDSRVRKDDTRPFI